MDEEKQKYLEFREKYKELDDSIHYLKIAFAQYKEWHSKNDSTYRNLKYSFEQIKQHEKIMFEKYKKKN